MRQHQEIKEATDAQVKEAAGKKLKRVGGDFPACMGRERDNKENKFEKK